MHTETYRVIRPFVSCASTHFQNTLVLSSFLWAMFELECGQLACYTSIHSAAVNTVIYLLCCLSPSLCTTANLQSEISYLPRDSNGSVSHFSSAATIFLMTLLIHSAYTYQVSPDPSFCEKAVCCRGSNLGRTILRAGGCLIIL